MSRAKLSSAPVASQTGPGTVSPVVGGANSRGMNRDRALELYRLMLISRRLDDAEIAMRKRNQAFFQISGAGHEAIGAALGTCLRAGHDWFIPYYRDRALALALGLTPTEVLYQAVAAAADPSSAARQMPMHYSIPSAHLVSQSSCVGTQAQHAAGVAEAGRIIARLGLDLPVANDEIVVATIGDGSTAQGEFHEALHIASQRRLPVLFVVEHNDWAISTPATENIPGGDLCAMLAGLPHLNGYDADGSDLPGLMDLLELDIVPRLRRRESGPVLLQVHVTRPYSHSLSDDHAAYRTAEDLTAESARDCLTRMAAWLAEKGWASERDLARLHNEVDKTVRAAVDAALEAPKPEPATALDHLYSATNPPTHERYAVEPAPADAEPVALGQAINRTLHDEMERNPAIVVFGQDVADCTFAQNLDKVKGKGGVFKITHGLQRRFGADRCFNSMLAEANIVGRAFGMAIRGLKPVVEIQFFDYIWPAMQQIRNELATMRYRSGGGWQSPVVVRVPIGGYLRGGAIYHSQSGENLFVQCPGLRVAYPSNAADAVGLLRTAMRCDDPVLFLEHKHLYYQGYNRAPYPGPDYTIPFGKAAIRRAGTDVTIVTWGALVQKSLEAAERLAKEEGRQAEVIDLRTLAPYDRDAILTSVRKTHRLVIASEENHTGSFAGEIAAMVAERSFEWLDAPVKRTTALDCWVAYSPILEEAILPQTEDVYGALLATVRY